MAAALNRFINRSSDKCHAFFQALKCSRRGFKWTAECDEALDALKRYLSSAPLIVTPKTGEDLFLYLAVSPHAVSAALCRREGADDQPVHFASKVLLSAQTRYLPLEKLALALITASRKLISYFQAHTIIVNTEHPLKALLRKADVSKRVSQWAVELANFDIRYEPRTAIKAQVLADFIAEFTPGEPSSSTLIPPQYDFVEQYKGSLQWDMFHGDYWKMHIDGASNQNGSRAGIVLKTPCGVLHECAVTLDFEATNNEAEYEALLAGLRLAVRLEVEELAIYCDSQLVVNQVNGDYVARDERMLGYLSEALELIKNFKAFKIEQINRENNARADALAGLASACKATDQRNITLETVSKPTFQKEEEVLTVSFAPSHYDEIVAYLKNDTLPASKKDAYRVRNKAAQYWLSDDGKLYRRSFTGPYLLVIYPEQVPSIIEELHSGSCGCHSGGRSLAHRAITQGYWWKNMKKDCDETVRTCKNCQIFSPIPHQPAQELSPITSPWSFTQWGLDIVGKLPTAPGKFKFFIAARITLQSGWKPSP